MSAALGRAPRRCHRAASGYDRLVRAPAFAAALATALCLAGGARGDEAPSWATAQAAALSREARDHAARGEAEAAIARYVEALRLDTTYAPAYLGLAAQYEARGDFTEAERTYAVGLDHVPGFTAALVSRGRLRARLGRAAEAIGDLEAAASIDAAALPVLRELAAAYVAVRALPAALAVTRRMAAEADRAGDATAATEARVQARALSLLVGDADPVAAGRAGRGAVRSALARLAKRR